MAITRRSRHEALISCYKSQLEKLLAGQLMKWLGSALIYALHERIEQIYEVNQISMKWKGMIVV